MISLNGYPEDDLAPLLQEGAGGFLVSFEPLLDKYGQLLSFASHEQWFVNLGLQHPRALVLPYAVDACETGRAVFHVTFVDGCSSLLQPTADFRERNRASSSTAWPEWVERECAALKESRVVPCVSLQTVLGEWLGSRPVARMKVDAQGMDLQVVKSAGALLAQLRYVILEAQSPLAAPLYQGQVLCPEVLSSMRSLGFVLADTTRQMRSLCNTSGAELDIHFIRQELRPSWRMFHKDYTFCKHFAAAGACGAPVCIAPTLHTMVNRTGFCDGKIVDHIDFGREATGMVVLRTSIHCRPHVNARRLQDSSESPQPVRLMINQGAVQGRRACPVHALRMAVINSSGAGKEKQAQNLSEADEPQLQVLRFRIGRGEDRDFQELVPQTNQNRFEVVVLKESSYGDLMAAAVRDPFIMYQDPFIYIYIHVITYTYICT